MTEEPRDLQVGGFQGRIKNLLSHTFLFTILLSLIPSIFLIIPVFLLTGALRSYQEIRSVWCGEKTSEESQKESKDQKKPEKSEDSGIDASDDDLEDKKTEETEDTAAEESTAKEPEMFNFERPFANLNFLRLDLSFQEPNERTKSTVTSLAEYLISSGKFPVLLTYGNLASLEKLEYDPTDVQSLTIQLKRKIRVRALDDDAEEQERTVERLTDILLEIFEKLNEPRSWFFLSDKKVTSAKVVNTWKSVTQIKMITEKMKKLLNVMETQEQDELDFPNEIIIPKRDGLMWFNPKL